MTKTIAKIVLVSLAVILCQRPVQISAYSAENLNSPFSYEWSSDGQSYYENGKKVTGQKKIGGYWYYFDEKTGKMVHGWKYIASQKKTVWYGQETGHMLYGEVRINGYWYYLNDKTGAVTYGWKYIAAKNKTVYYDKDGHMVYGKQTIDGKVYEFNKNSGALISGTSPLGSTPKQDTVKNGWNSAKDMYYADGKYITGQKKIDGYWYYFDEKTGKMVHGWKYIASQKKTVWYGQETGHMLYGEVRINGYWYYLNDKTGAVTYGWKVISAKNKTVYYDKDGHMVYGKQTIDGKVYEFDKNTGALISGTSQVSATPKPETAANGWNAAKDMYYADGKYITGEKKIDGYWYYFDEKTGKMVHGWKVIEAKNKTVYYDKDGHMVYGRQTIDGKVYEFNKNSGALISESSAASQNVTNGWNAAKDMYYIDGKYITGQKKIGGYWYYFDDETGKMVHGWKYIESQKKTVWYGQETGHMLYGEVRINGYWYYLNDKTGAVTHGWKTIPDKNLTVYYNKDGRKLFGMQEINGKTYYLHDETGNKLIGFEKCDSKGHYAYTTADGYVQTGQYKINGNYYYFSEKTGHSIQGWLYIPAYDKIVYFDNESKRAAGTMTIDGKTYSFDMSSGALLNIKDLDKSIISKAIAATSAISRPGKYGIVTKNGKKYVVIAGREYESQNTETQVNVLFIGNSYTYYNLMPWIFKDLATAAGVNMEVKMIASGAQTFWGHYTDSKVKTELRSGKYDYVIIQGQSTEVQENWKESHDSARYLINLAKEKKPAIYLFEQMSYNGDPGGQPRIHTTYTQISEENGDIPVIHAGEAFWQYASEHPNANMFHDDRHPSKTGSEVIAKAIWDGMKVDILYNLK